MAFFAASKPKQNRSISGKSQQQKRAARKQKYKQMASEAKQHNKKNKKKKKKQNKEQEKHLFSPALPTWPIQVKQYIEQQLQKYEYFRKRPHVYPCDDFESFVNKINATLQKTKTDFCWSLDWDPVFFSQLIYNGFLTIASEIQDNLYVMLPKLHQQRCIIDLDINSSTCDLPLPVSKSTKKKSKNYTVTVDQCFEKVFQHCINQHGLNWLYPPMQAVLYKIFHNRKDPQLKGVTAHSIEIWNRENELVAGELGTSVGAIYTSLTGFYIESGTGSIQLLVLGHLLQKSNFLLWDLGMFIEYKSNLGGKLLARNEFINKYRCLRDDKNVKLECKEKVNCRDIVNINKESDMKEEEKNNKPLSNNARKRLAKKEKRRLAKLKAKQEKEKKEETDNNNIDVVGDDDVGDDDEYKQIEKALQENCGNDWKVYINNFKNHQVKDSDLDAISIDDLKELIPQKQAMIGFKTWMDSRK